MKFDDIQPYLFVAFLIIMVVWAIIYFIEFMVSGGWKWLLVIIGICLIALFTGKESG